jgi:hypothetical protein
MARDRKFDETISTWLEETAPSRLPERVLGATFERTRRTRQQLGWRTFLGRTEMPRIVPALGSALVVATTVVAIALVVSFQLIQNGIGGPATQPPRQVPTQPPTASPSQAAPQTPDQWGCFDLGAHGGDFRTSVKTISVSATVPDGWYGGRDGFYIQNAPCLFGASLSLEINLVRTVYSDACHWRSSAVEATTPAAVTAALAAQKGPNTFGPTDTTVGGHPASRFDLTIPADLDLEACDDDNLRLAHDGSAGEGFARDPGTGEGTTFYVVDVDGLAVGVSACCSTEETTPAQLAQLDAVVASLQFEP